MTSIADADRFVNRSCVPNDAVNNRASSAALAAANARLLARRQQHQQTQSSTQATAPAADGVLPVHLGWSSASTTRIFRQQTTSQAQTATKTDLSKTYQLTSQHESAASLTPDNTHADHDTFKLYPELAAAFLQQKVTALGRLWLYCRQLDHNGSGQITLQALRHSASSRDSEQRICGQRRLRELIRSGDGRFWTRSKTHLWLYSAARVSQQLHVKRLKQRPLYLKRDILNASVRIVRAQFYGASIAHLNKAPISRACLTTMTGVSERSQRRYDDIANVQRESCIAVGERLDTNAFETFYSHRQQATFVLTDRQGKQGPAGARYCAWQLPNRYQTSYSTAPSGRQRKINRWLHAQSTDLVNQRARGNGNQPSIQRRYYLGAKQIPLSATHSESETRYWFDTASQTWQALSIHTQTM